MLILLTVLGLLGVHGVTAAINCHMRELDLCLATIMISASDGVPATEEEIDRVCEPIQEGFECTGNYSKDCFTPFMMDIYDMVVAEPREMQQKFCTRGSDERTQYLKHAGCFQKVLTPEKVKPHVDDMLATLEAATEAKFSERIPILCCGMQRMLKSSTGIVEAECGSEVMKDGSAIMGFSVSSVSEMFCRGFEHGSPKCDGILPPSGSPTKGINSENQLIRFISTAMENFS